MEYTKKWNRNQVCRGIYSAGPPSDNNSSLAMALVLLLILFVALGAAGAVFLGIRISQGISMPIVRVVDAAKQIAIGRVEVDLSDMDSKDETGQLAQALSSGATNQSAAIEQINQGLSQVSSVFQANAATAEESSASSEELAAQAQSLKQEVNRFQLKE